jgi:hypothetical protein
VYVTLSIMIKNGNATCPHKSFEPLERIMREKWNATLRYPCNVHPRNTFGTARTPSNERPHQRKSQTKSSGSFPPVKHGSIPHTNYSGGCTWLRSKPHIRRYRSLGLDPPIQYLFGIRIHHDAGPDIGKRSAFSRPPRRIGGFCVGATPQQGGSTPERFMVF